MKHRFLIATLLMWVGLPHLNAEGFAGEWLYEATRPHSRATLAVQGTSLSGSVVEGPTTYTVNGTIQALTASTTISAPGVQAQAQMTVNGDQLTVTFSNGHQVLYQRQSPPAPVGGLGAALGGAAVQGAAVQGAAVKDAAAAMDGIYHFTDPTTGMLTEVKLTQTGDQLNGAVSENGMQMQLMLQRQDAQRFSGQIVLPNQQQLPCALTKTAAGFDLVVSVGAQQQSFTFVPAPAQGGVTPPGQPGQPALSNVERDQRIIGVWRHTEVMSSGDFSMASDTFLEVKADGSYVMSSGGMAGGGAAGTFDAGGGGEVLAAGQWSTKGGMVRTRDHANGPWVDAATYVTDGTSLMLTTNGEKTIYNRVR